MRSPNDETQEETTGVTPEELFDTSPLAHDADKDDGGLSAAANTQSAMDLLGLLNQSPQTAPPAEETPAPPPPDSWTMVLIEGNGVREIEFVEGQRVGQEKPNFGGDDSYVAPPPPPPASNPAIDLLEQGNDPEVSFPPLGGQPENEPSE